MGGWRAWRALAAKGMPIDKAVPATLAVWVALAAIGLVLLPANTDPVEAPATLIWQFRLATVAGAGAYWSVTGLVFGWLRVRAWTDVVMGMGTSVTATRSAPSSSISTAPWPVPSPGATPMSRSSPATA